MTSLHVIKFVVACRKLLLIGNYNYLNIERGLLKEYTYVHRLFELFNARPQNCILG
jgi:hypothetical protein